MLKLYFPKSTSHRDLPYDSINKAKYSVYVVDLEWNYLFVNHFVSQNLGEKGKNLKGKNVWKTFPELSHDATYRALKKQSEEGRESCFIIISPLTLQKLYITGQRLHDCFLFTSSILPKKEDVISDLKNALKQRQ